MAHDIEENDVMSYQGDTPWHGLGHDITGFDESAPLDVRLERVGLNYEVLSSPAQFTVGDDLLTFEGKNVLHCSDNRLPLSVVSDGYKVVQPRDVFEIYDEISRQHDLTLETCGTLSNRKRLWALARVPESSIRIMGQDEVNPYILLGTSYDGTMATVAQFTSVRVVCNNTLQASLSRDSGLRISHNTKINNKTIANALLYSVSDWQEFGEHALEFAKRKLKPGELVEYFLEVLYGEEALEEREVKMENSSVKKNIAQLAGLSRFGKGAELRSSDGTLWGALNSVTEFVDHYKGSSNDTRLNSAWFGEGRKIKNTAYEIALKKVA